MIPLPPSFYARVATLVVTTALSTAAPFVIQNKPGRQWVYDKVEMRVVNRVVDAIPGIDPVNPVVEPEVPVEPIDPDQEPIGILRELLRAIAKIFFAEIR